MISLLVAVRNFTVAMILAWMGFSLTPDSEDKKETNSAAPTNAMTSFIGR